MFGARPLYTVVVCQDLGFTIMHSPTSDGAQGLFEGAIATDQVECAAWYDTDYRLQNAYSRVAAQMRGGSVGVPDETRLEELPIPTRAYNSLINDGHKTVGDVRRAIKEADTWGGGDSYLLRLPNFGRTSLAQWKKAVR